MIITAAQKQLGEFLRHAAEGLDIPDTVRDEARRKYEHLGQWLKVDHEATYSSDAGKELLEQRTSGRLKVAAGTGTLGAIGARTVAKHTNYGD